MSDCNGSSVSEDDFSEDVLNVLDGAKKLFQYDASRRQATSIIMLAVIGSEFQKDLGALISSKAEKSANQMPKKLWSQGNSLSSRFVGFGHKLFRFLPSCKIWYDQRNSYEAGKYLGEL